MARMARVVLLRSFVDLYTVSGTPASARVRTNVTNVGQVDFTRTPALFSVGDGVLNMSANCVRGACTFNFETNDYFIDALDIYDQWQGNQDIPLLSSPYPINYRWTVRRSYGQ